MPGLLSKLSANSSKKQIEPREIFMGLPQKDGRYEYPRDVQSEVWKKWFAVRDKKNCIIKMNTGSGKTVVGLLVLQSCLNEGKGPAVYVVPDRYLVSQVCDQAQKLGINVTEDRDDFLYSENKSILVIPIQSLINGHSVFGMRSAGRNYPIGSVLVDDVHTCLDKINQQYSIRIPDDHDLYDEIISLFAERWKNYNQVSYTNVAELSDPFKSFLIPFWMWQESITDIIKIFSKYNNDESDNKNIYFALPLLADMIGTCNCIITSKCIEITPMGNPIVKIKSFAEAKRRIFMSATLSDDSVFASSIGLSEDEINNIITPDNANDLGDRLILFPRYLNNTITNEKIREKVLETAEKYNVIVIVPSKARARFWDENENCTVTRMNIEDEVTALKETHIGLRVFVNRYDGVDLPNDACRMLVIDGLPPLNSEYDQYIQSVDAESSILVRKQIQRIEQGMGRGVRSNSDSCCIVLMGDNLADILVRNNGLSYFSTTTEKQYELSKELWGLLKEQNPNPSIDDIWEIADYSLNRDPEWIQKSKENLSSINYNNTPKIDKISASLRKAFEYSYSKQWLKATEEIDRVLNGVHSSETRGYLLQIKATYMNFIDQATAQQVQLSAHNSNVNVLSPLEGIQYQKSINIEHQSKNICFFIAKTVSGPNELVLYWNAIANDLVFSPDADRFEHALEITGSLLGFISTRPDKETNGAGPDNLWALGEKRYFVIECKSGATSDTISKSYCNQLGGSVRWFNNEYGNDFQCQAIMIHPSTIIADQATAVEGMRVMSQENIKKLQDQIGKCICAMVQNNNWSDESKIDLLLKQYKLRARDLIQEYTSDFSEQTL